MEQTISPEVTKIVNKFRNYKSLREKWAEQAAQDWDFGVLLKQWTKDQEEDLKERGQAPLVIDRISPAIETQKSILIARAPGFRVIGRTDDDVRKAKIFSDLLSHIYYVNDGDMVVSEVVEHQIVMGVGWFYVRFDPYESDGEGEIILESVNPFDVFPDPHSRKLDCRDADCVFISNMLTIDQAVRLVPDREKEIRALVSDEDSNYPGTLLHAEEDQQVWDEVIDPDRKTIRWIEQYELVSLPYYQIADPETGEVETVDEATFKELQKSETKFEHKKIYRKRVKKTVICGTLKIGTEYLPTSIYPLIPVFYSHAGNPYAIGAVRKVRGLQQEINKRRSLMIAHATSSTVPHLLIEKGVVDDVEQFEVDRARPGGVTEVNSIEGMKPLEPQPLPTALYQLEMEAKYDIEYLLGTFAQSMGSAREAHPTFKGTLAIEEWGNRRVALRGKALEYALKRVGKVIIDFIQGYYTSRRIIRIVNPDQQALEKPRFIGLNMPTYDEFTAEEIERINDVSVGEYDVIVVPGSMLPSNRWAELEYYMKMLEIGAIDKVEFWKKTDIIDREGLIKRFSEYSQLQQQVQALAEENKMLKSQYEQLRSRLIEARESRDVEKFKSTLKEMEVEEKKKFIDILQGMKQQEKGE